MGWGWASASHNMGALGDGLFCHLSAVIPHFEDGSLPADLLAVSLLPAALIFSI